MKKLCLMVFIGLFLAGCGAKDPILSEFLKHNTMYRSNDHMYFSMQGYRTPTPETSKKSQEEGWWGIPVK